MQAQLPALTSELGKALAHLRRRLQKRVADGQQDSAGLWAHVFNCSSASHRRAVDEAVIAERHR